MGDQFALKNNQIFVLAEAAGGVYNSDQLRILCEVADNESAFLKITEDQRIGFMIDPAKLPDVQAQVRRSGLLLRSYKAAGVPSPRACLGELCTFAHQPSLGDALELTTHLLKIFPSPKRFSTIGVNGCSRACLGSSTEDIHVVAEESGYKISIGGKGAEIPQQAQLLLENVSRADLPLVIEKILSVFYQESQDGERIFDVIDRIGLTPFFNALPEHLAPAVSESSGESDLSGLAPDGELAASSQNPDEELDKLIDDSSMGELGATPMSAGIEAANSIAQPAVADVEVPDGLLEEAEFEDGTLEDVERVRDAIRTELNMDPSSEAKESAKHTDLFDELESAESDMPSEASAHSEDSLDEASAEEGLHSDNLTDEESLNLLDSVSAAHGIEQPANKTNRNQPQRTSSKPREAHATQSYNQHVSGRLAIKFLGSQLGVELPSGMCFELPFDAVPEGEEFSMHLPDGELRMERHGAMLNVHLGALNMRFPIPNADEDQAA